MIVYIYVYCRIIETVTLVHTFLPHVIIFFGVGDKNFKIYLFRHYQVYINHIVNCSHCAIYSIPGTYLS